MKRIIFGMVALAVGFVFCSQVFAEDITLTTYYPSPYGVYKQLTVTDNLYLKDAEGANNDVYMFGKDGNLEFKVANGYGYIFNFEDFDRDRIVMAVDANSNSALRIQNHRIDYAGSLHQYVTLNAKPEIRMVQQLFPLTTKYHTWLFGSGPAVMFGNPTYGYIGVFATTGGEFTMDPVTGQLPPGVTLDTYTFFTQEGHIYGQYKDWAGVSHPWQYPPP